MWSAKYVCTYGISRCMIAFHFGRTQITLHAKRNDEAQHGHKGDCVACAQAAQLGAHIFVDMPQRWPLDFVERCRRIDVAADVIVSMLRLAEVVEFFYSIRIERKQETNRHDYDNANDLRWWCGEVETKLDRIVWSTIKIAFLWYFNLCIGTEMEQKLPALMTVCPQLPVGKKCLHCWQEGEKNESVTRQKSNKWPS